LTVSCKPSFLRIVPALCAIHYDGFVSCCIARLFGVRYFQYCS